MRPRRVGTLLGAILVIQALAVGGCRQLDRAGGAVDVVYAASLTAVMRDGLEPAYRRAEGREVRGVPRGSSAGALQVRDGILRADAYVTADPATLEMLGDRDPGWAVVFARGELVLGYAGESRFAAALDSAAAAAGDGTTDRRVEGVAWHEVVRRPGFRLGRTDPGLDPKGYRALWLFRLSEAHYGVPGLARELRRTSGVYPEEHLAARVETGQLDAGIFYRSEARAHGLRSVPLPPEVNLGDPDRAGRYREMTYRTPAGERIRGAPVAYAATVPADAGDPPAGAGFVAFLLSPAGREALRSRGYRPASRVLGDEASLPAAVRRTLADHATGTSGDPDGRIAPASPVPPREPRAGMSTRKTVAVLVLAVWMAVLGWHAKRLYLRPEAEVLAAAARTLPPGVSYYAVYQGDRHAGWARSEVDTLPDGDGFRLQDRMRVSLQGLGLPGGAELRSRAELGPALGLRSFRVEASGLLGGLTAEGEVSRDSVLSFRVVRGGDTTRRSVRLDGPVVPSTALPLRVAVEGDSEAGDRYRIQTFDPLQLSYRTQEVRVLERKVLTVPDSATRHPSTGAWVVARHDTVTAWRVAREMAGVELESWIDEDGRYVEVSTGAGLRLERTAFELAYFGSDAGRDGARP